MIFPCSSEILFNAPCQYGGEVDTDKHAYSERKIGNAYYRYHYLDWERSKKELVVMSSSVKRDLAKHLLELKVNGNKSKWVVAGLHSLGLNPDD